MNKKNISEQVYVDFEKFINDKYHSARIVRKKSGGYDLPSIDAMFDAFVAGHKSRSVQEQNGYLDFK